MATAPCTASCATGDHGAGHELVECDLMLDTLQRQLQVISVSNQHWWALISTVSPLPPCFTLGKSWWPDYYSSCGTERPPGTVSVILYRLTVVDSVCVCMCVYVCVCVCVCVCVEQNILKTGPHYYKQADRHRHTAINTDSLGQVHVTSCVDNYCISKNVTWCSMVVNFWCFLICWITRLCIKLISCSVV